MKNFINLTIVIALTALSINVLGQNPMYPFEVSISGKGTQPIIFVPGFACSGEVWDSTKSIFEKDFICYTLTMAGFAGVPAQPKSSFQSWEKGIAKYIQENKVNKPIVMGHSMGGALAMALASDYPELISKIIVVDALPCLAALMDPSFKTNENNDCSTMVLQFTSIPNEQFYQMQKGGMSRMLADISKTELVVNWSLKSDRTTMAEMYCDFSNTDLRGKIINIHCPALILLESYFVNLKPAINEQFKNMKNVNLQYADKGLHFIMYDNKEWYDKQLNIFLSNNKE